MFVAPGQNGPLYYLTLRLWLCLAGLSGYALRFFSVFFGTLAVPLIYRLSRRLFPASRTISLLAAILAATSPYLIWYSQEGKMYSLVVVLVILSMDRYLDAMDRGGWHRWLLLVVLTGAAVYVHFVAALMIPVYVGAFFFWESSKRRARWKAWLASLGLLILPYLPLLRWQLPLALSPAETGYRFVPLHDMLTSLLVSYSLGPIAGALRWTSFLFVVLLLAAAFGTHRRSQLPAAMGTLAIWLSVPVLGFFLLTLVRPMYTARYLIFVVPAFMILLAAGAAATARRSRWLAGLLLAAILVLNGVGVWRQSQTTVKADFRSATKYVADRMSADDLLIFQIPYGRHSFDYYLERYEGRPSHDGQEAAALPDWPSRYQVFMPLVAGDGVESYRWADGLYTNYGMDPRAAASSLERLTAGSEFVWLIASEVDLWDQRGLVQAWLEQNCHLAEAAHFVRVSVYRYETR